MRAALAQLQCPPYRRRQILLVQKLYDVVLIERRDDTPLTGQPGLELRQLVDAGDGAVRDVGQLGVKLGASCLGNCAGRFGQLAVNIEPARINAQVELPDYKLFG